MARAALYTSVPPFILQPQTLLWSVEPHRDGNCLSLKDDVLQTVLDVKESRQACTFKILLKRELFDEKDS